jgi:hypothetical protein
MKTNIIILLSLVYNIAIGQCASDYVGDYGGRKDFESAYNFNAEIIEINPNRVLIRNFTGQPNFVFQPSVEDTIYANLDCQNNSLTLDPTYYIIGAGFGFTFFGTGELHQDSVVLYITTDSATSGPQWTILLKKGATVFNISEKELPKTFQIYPNPTSTYLAIKEEFIGHNFKILSVNGAIVKEGTISGNEIMVDNLSEGLFLLILYDEGLPIWKSKFIKSK